MSYVQTIVPFGTGPRILPVLRAARLMDFSGQRGRFFSARHTYCPAYMSSSTNFLVPSRPIYMVTFCSNYSSPEEEDKNSWSAICCAPSDRILSILGKGSRCNGAANDPDDISQIVAARADKQMPFSSSSLALAIEMNQKVSLYESCEKTKITTKY